MISESRGTLFHFTRMLVVLEARASTFSGGFPGTEKKIMKTHFHNLEMGYL